MAPVITGIGSVSAYGPVGGLIAARDIEPQVRAEWDGARAFFVEPFRPAAVVPGLKTRKLDRLSVWALVASALAIRDAGFEPAGADRSRVAVVLGTGFGCVETTEAYFRTVASSGYGNADPILFPDSLDNSPAGHVARHFGFTGPNITLSCRGVSGEAALIQAASLVRSGEADVVVALAGDTLTRTLCDWYRAARVRSVAGEGLAAVVMEAGGKRGYCRYVSGSMAGDPKAPRTAPRTHIGEFDGNGVLALVAALSGIGAERLQGGSLVLSRVSAGGGCATVVFE